MVRGRYIQALQGPIYAVTNDQRLRQERGTCKTNTPGICINVREKEERLQSGGQRDLKTATKPAFREENHSRPRKGHVVDHGIHISLDSGSVEESNCGYQKMLGFLSAQGLHVQEARVRGSMHRGTPMELYSGQFKSQQPTEEDITHCIYLVYIMYTSH